MSKFPLVEAMGLEIYHDEDFGYFVSIRDLEKALRDAPIVYQDKNFEYWGKSPTRGKEPLEARLICIQPLKKKTKTEAAIEFMQKFVEQKTLWHSQSAWDEAKKILEMEDNP